MADTAELIGFITVVEHGRLGLIGGYLILNPAGRPVEFHCTAPIRPTRTQEILYGSALYPFLYGEQIAGTLFHKARLPVSLLLTDSIPVLAIQDLIEIPVVFVKREENDATVKMNENDEVMHGSLRAFGILPRTAGESDIVDSEHCVREEYRDSRFGDIPGFSVARWREQELDKRHIALPEGLAISVETLREHLQLLMKTLDLLEPFERIRLAVEETQKAA